MALPFSNQPTQADYDMTTPGFSTPLEPAGEGTGRNPLLAEMHRRKLAGTLKPGGGSWWRKAGGAARGAAKSFDKGVTQKLGRGAKNLVSDPQDWLGNVGQDWQKLVASDLGWAVPFAWPEKAGAMAGMWGPGGVMSPAGGMPAPMGGLGMMGGGGAAGMTLNQFGQQGQPGQQGGQEGFGTLGANAGNVASSFGQQPQFQQPQQRQPYFLGSGGLGRLT